MPLSSQRLVVHALRFLCVVELVDLDRLRVHIFQKLLHHFQMFTDTRSLADLTCFIVSTQFAPFVFFNTRWFAATSLWSSS